MDENSDAFDVEGKIFIGGLSWQTTEATLRLHFEKYGELEDVAMMIDKRTGQPRGFGFIKMKVTSDADVIVQKEHFIDGRKVDVKRAVPRDKAPAPTRTESKKIFVGGLSGDVTDTVFSEYFCQFGAVKDAVVMLDRTTDRSRGFGFVTFENDADVEKVLSTENTIMGKWVEVKRAEPRDVKGFDGSGGGSPRNGNYTQQYSRGGRGAGTDGRGGSSPRGYGSPRGGAMVPEEYPPYGAMYMGPGQMRGGYQRGYSDGYPPGYGPASYAMPYGGGYPGGYPGAYAAYPAYAGRGPVLESSDGSGSQIPGAGHPGGPGGYDTYGRGPVGQYPYGSSALAGYGGAYGYTGAYPVPVGRAAEYDAAGYAGYKATQQSTPPQAPQGQQQPGQPQQQQQGQQQAARSDRGFVSYS